MKQADQIAMLEQMLDRHLGWISAADSRAAMPFALCTAMLGALAAVSPVDPRAWQWVPALLGVLASASLLASLGCLTQVSFPRVDGPKRSLIYFGTVSRATSGQFIEDVNAMSLEDYAEDLAKQCHRNAEIAARKFRWLKKAHGILYLAVPIWAAAVLFIYQMRT